MCNVYIKDIYEHIHIWSISSVIGFNNESFENYFWKFYFRDLLWKFSGTCEFIFAFNIIILVVSNIPEIQSGFRKLGKTYPTTIY